jgi:hypothetical protein
MLSIEKEALPLQDGFTSIDNTNKKENTFA